MRAAVGYLAPPDACNTSAVTVVGHAVLITVMQKGRRAAVSRIRVKRFGVEVSQSGVLLQQSLEVSCFRVLELLEKRRNQGRRVTE